MPHSLEPEDLLQLPVELGSRKLALRFVREALDAAARANDPRDIEALHDLRVALRRLRTAVRAYPELQQSLSKAERARLRELARETGAARDAEVLLHWATRAHAERADPALARLKRTLTKRRKKAYEALRAQTLAPLRACLGSLEEALRHYALPFVIGRELARETLAAATAQAAQRQTKVLLRKLRRIEGPGQEALAHQARIEGKRLRYLLEPHADAASAASLDALRKLQTLLGDLHDRAVRAALLEESERVASPVDRRALAALRVREDKARRRLIGRTITRWLHDEGGIAGLRRALRGTLSALTTAPDASSAVGLPLEIERKYLLRALPAEALGAAYVDIDQGWIPGQVIHERLRRKKSDAGQHFYRTIKVGQGLARVELEEEIGRALFAKLWALTKGRRVQKRRYLVPDEASGLTFEVDAFRGRTLFLAEVELPSVETTFTMPAWLADVLVREVTGQAEYVNLNLAR